jgi:hypothetical protein
MTTTHATLTADATHHNTGEARAFAEPSAKNARGKPNGYVRLGNKRAGAPGKPKPGEIAIDIDRQNRVLGNPFILGDANDKAARADVIERFAVKYRADLACDGPMAASNPSSRRAREDRRTHRVHVLVLAQAMPRHSHHRRDQATARIRAVNQIAEGGGPRGAAPSRETTNIAADRTE